MKTVAELNKKWWYRLLKVIFVGFLVICALISIASIWEDSRPHEVSDYRVDCVASYTNHATFYAHDAGVYPDLSITGTIYSTLSDYEKQIIKDKCDISQEEVSYSQQQALAYIQQQDALGATQKEIQDGVDTNYRPYTITKAMKVEGSFGKVIGSSVLAIGIILIVGEIVRRIFYYIVLGSVRPKKTVHTG
jgi:hypothetical protein